MAMGNVYSPKGRKDVPVTLVTMVTTAYQLTTLISVKKSHAKTTKSVSMLMDTLSEFYFMNIRNYVINMS